MDTKRTLYEIEVALSKSDKFNYIKNIVAFNINGLSERLPIFHECDMLVVSKSGYLSEIEIKRSYSDFLSDFKKKHHHDNCGIIKHFYYCVPLSILEKVKTYLDKNLIYYTSVIAYDEELKLTFHDMDFGSIKDKNLIDESYSRMNCHKLFIEQQLEIARLGVMRTVRLKEKINQLTDEINHLKIEKHGLENEIS